MPVANYWQDFRSALKAAMMAAVPELADVYPVNLARRNGIAAMIENGPFGVIRLPRPTVVNEYCAGGDTTFAVVAEMSLVFSGAENEAPLHDALERLRAWFDDATNVVTGAQDYTRIPTARWVRFDDDEPLNDRATSEGVQALAATLGVQFWVDEGA